MVATLEAKTATPWKLQRCSRNGSGHVDLLVALGSDQIASASGKASRDFREKFESDIGAIRETKEATELQRYRDASAKYEQEVVDTANAITEAQAAVETAIRDGESPGKAEAALAKLEEKSAALVRRRPIVEKMLSDASANFKRAALRGVGKLFETGLSEALQHVRECEEHIAEAIGPLLLEWIAARQTCDEITMRSGRKHETIEELLR